MHFNHSTPMTLSVFQFVNVRGTTGPAEKFVEYSPATAVSFRDNQWADPGSFSKLVDQGLQAGDEVDTSGVVACPAGAFFTLSVTSRGYGHFSLHDGNAWVGPFPVVADVTKSMLVRTSATNPTVRVLFHADHASAHVLIEAGEAVSPAQRDHI